MVVNFRVRIETLLSDFELSVALDIGGQSVCTTTLQNNNLFFNY